MGQVIYVTGAPASGKSTTTQALLKAMPGVALWEYGARLTEHLRSRGVDLVDQKELREKSSHVALGEVINEVDDHLLAFVAERRAFGHVIIDSHPVTREHYGFRITAFSHERFRMLAPNEVWCFYTAPEIAIARIEADPRGRPQIDVETARTHTSLQASVAATYGIAAGCPVYLFDTDREQSELVTELKARLEC